MAKPSLLVFLGGTCGESTWRKAIVEPIFSTHPRITAYNPHVADWKPELVQKEKQAIQDADLLLFALTTETRGLASLIEIVHYVLTGKPLVLAIDFFDPSQSLKVSPAEVAILNEARSKLLSLAHRHKIPSFANVGEAAQYCVSLCNVPKESWPAHHVAASSLMKAFNNSGSGDTQNRHPAYFEMERRKQFSLKVTKSQTAQQYAANSLLPSLRQEPPQSPQLMKGFERIHVVDLGHRGAILHMMDITEQSLQLHKRNLHPQAPMEDTESPLLVYFLNQGPKAPGDPIQAERQGYCTSQNELIDVYRASRYLKDLLVSNGDQVHDIPSSALLPSFLNGPQAMFLITSLTLVGLHLLRLRWGRS